MASFNTRIYLLCAPRIMGNQCSLVLTIEKTELAGEIMSSASVLKTSTTGSSIPGSTSSSTSDTGVVGNFQLVVPIPRELDVSKEFYLYLPMHRKVLIRSGISLVQDPTMDDKKSGISLKRLLEWKIYDLNMATVQTTEAITSIIKAGGATGIVVDEAKLTADAPDVPGTPDGTSDIYKCQVSDVSSGEPVKMEKICSSTYFWLRGESLYRGTILTTKITRPSNFIDSPNSIDNCSPIKWETIFKLLQSMPSQRPAMEKCLEIQQEIDDVNFALDDLAKYEDPKNQFTIELSNRRYFEREELEAKINAVCSKILFGK